MKHRPSRHLRSLLLVLSLAGCQTSTAGSATPLPAKSGGTLIFATDQHPKCLNPLTDCARLEWLRMAVLRPTMAQLLTLDAAGSYAPTALVPKIPSVTNRAGPGFRVTYRLNPAAVWDDGTPITGDDIRFTWEAYRTNPSTREEYERITSVVPAPHAVTLEFAAPYAQWKGLFPYVLKADAFAGNPGAVGSMLQDSLPFSGGPFRLQSFTESEIVLVRNDRYYGPKPLLDKVIYRKLEVSKQVRAFSTGEVHAFFPPITPELGDIAAALPGAKIKVKGSNLVEGLWFNLDAFPVSDPAVREALLHGLNRQAAVEASIKPVYADAAVHRCLWSVPDLDHGRWCNDDFPVRPDRDRARRALERAGWVKGPDGIYSKGTDRLVIPVATTRGNKIREHFQQLLQEEARDLGIEIRSDNDTSTELLTERLPARRFTVAMFAWKVEPDPSVTAVLAKDMLPPRGRNYYGWQDDVATGLMRQADTELDEGRRRRLFAELGAMMARDIISIPLYQRPQMLVWDGARLEGDFDFSSTLGFSPQLSTWYLK